MARFVMTKKDMTVNQIWFMVWFSKCGLVVMFISWCANQAGIMTTCRELFYFRYVHGIPTIQAVPIDSRSVTLLSLTDTMMKLLFENFSKSCPLFKIAYIYV